MDIRQVTLRQVLSFLHGLTAEGGPRVEMIRLARPKGKKATNLWNIAMELQYLVYNPDSGTARPAAGT